MNIRRSRVRLDSLISNYGVTVMVHGDDALGELANLIRGSSISREELAELVAFATRRLWNKKSDPVRPSVN